MSVQHQKRTFILVKNCFGKKLLEPKVKPGEKGIKIETEIQILAGTLLKEIQQEQSAILFKSLDHENVLVQCHSNIVHELDPHEADMLIPITNFRERIKIFEDSTWIEDILQDGSPVIVYLPDCNEAKEGIVRYWGRVPEVGKGCWFGVELLKGIDKNSCDGSIKGRRYFQCAENRGIFVPLNCLEPCYAPSSDTSKQGSSTSKPPPIPLEVVCSAGAPPPPLGLNDRVVWISDTGPEYGVVKWLGKLPDVGTNWMVGVEFDNPVGTGTGKYNDHQLFDAKLNHASLVPIIGLMKAEDFANDSLPPKPIARVKKNDSTLLERNKILENGSAKPKGSPISIKKGLLQTESNLLVNLPAPSSSASNTTTLIETTDCAVNPLYEYEMLSEKNDYQKINHNKISDKAYSSLPSSTPKLEIGSVVEVLINNDPCYGVIRWIGEINDPSRLSYKLYAGIEMEEENSSCTDGTFNGKRYFHCPSQKGYFSRLNNCRKDSRFQEKEVEKKMSTEFGSIDCPTVSGDVPPLSRGDELYGKNRGIQGHHNSCYLDATLFSMFSCTSVFDSLLHRPKRLLDIPEYELVQKVLKEDIVNPLRANFYVRADRVMKLRQLLDRLSSVSGLTSEEKDPEEFLNSLLNQILKAEPFLKLSSGHESYLYQLFVEKDDRLTLPTVQQLFDQSFLTSDIKLQEVPACLLIQMPRFGKQFKMYPRILPSQYLDITDVLDDSPRQCSVCGQLAEYECKECFGQISEGLESIAFCTKCMEKSHSHKKRSKHKSTRLRIPSEFHILKEHTPIPRIYMELFAVMCIETSHYVSFVKCGTGPDAPWCFFDSMADRKGEQNGYNIPEVVHFPDLRWWLSEEGATFLQNTRDEKALPEIARRLLCDAYMCMYQSPEVMMYR